MTPEQLDAIEAACTDGIAQHRSSGVGEFTILSLVAAVRESERALETQKKVADTFRQCLTDTYRPHVEENKMLRDLISHYDPMLRERDNTIARVRAVGLLGLDEIAQKSIDATVARMQDQLGCTPDDLGPYVMAKIVDSHIEQAELFAGPVLDALRAALDPQETPDGRM